MTPGKRSVGASAAVVLLGLGLTLYSTRDQGSEAPALRVEYAGCWSSRQGPICQIEAETELRVWISSEPGSEIEVDPAALREPPAEEARIEGGRRMLLRPKEGASRLVVRARREDAVNQWTLDLAPRRPSGSLRDARSLIDDRRFDEARQALELALPRLTPAEIGYGHGLLASVARKTGDRALAGDHLRQAIRAHRAVRQLYDELRNGTLLIDLLMGESDYPAVRRELRALPINWHAPAEARYYVAYYRGLLALNTGDFHTSLNQLGQAARQAERLGLVREKYMAQEMLAQQLQRTGRRDAAAHLLAEALAAASQAADTCEYGQLLNNVAWSHLLTLEAGEVTQNPLPLLRKALTLVETHCPERRGERSNILTNLALAHLHAGSPKRSRHYLDQARTWELHSATRIRLWALDTEGRIELAEKRPDEALRHFEALEQMAQATLSDDFRWRATIGRALAHESRGEAKQSLQAFREAESQLDGQVFQIPINAGRATFLARHSWATTRFLDLLLKTARESEAFALVRRSRTRVLTGLQHTARVAALDGRRRDDWEAAIATYRQRRDELTSMAEDEWQVPADLIDDVLADRETKTRDLSWLLANAFALLERPARRTVEPSPRQNELILAFHPTVDGWVSFAAQAGEISVVKTKCAPNGPISDFGACLLEPFQLHLKQVESIRILPAGASRKVDFHASSIGGAPLVASHPVVYSLDLPSIDPPTIQAPGKIGQALLVGDPGNDLPQARREIEVISALLEAEGGWDVEVLLGDQAHVAQVRRRLENVDLFHYAGHAQFGGLSDWESALPLARNSQLSLSDIVTLKSVPSLVVLSGCETGRSSSEVLPESVGLAHAMISGGANLVLAAVRPLDDTTAAVLVHDFYQQWMAGASADVALQRAQIALRASDPSADWSSFRLIVP